MNPQMELKPMRPTFITFTGADERTSVEDMAALQKRYPIEWGILFSKTQQGNSKRFPGMSSIAKIEAAMTSPRSAHLCGAHVRRIMDGEFDPLAFNFVPYRRVQVNHHDGPFDFGRVLDFTDRLAARVICHFRGAESFPADGRVDWLFDASFGAGIEPERWPPHPDGVRLVGYAGGIGPDNVERIIEKIDAKGPYWIDMEARVRTDDWFDLEKCRRVCEAVYGPAKVESDGGGT